MMSLVTDKFFVPIAVLVLGGLLTYWVQLMRQRVAIRKALISEINLLFRDAVDYKEYLSQERHDWLKKGARLKESPVFVASSKRVFNAMLPQLWLLPRSELQKVLLFYSHVEDCENLIQILFGRIHKQEQIGKPLDAKQIAVTKVRIKRILKGLDSALRITNGKIDKLGELPQNHDLPTAKDTSKELGSFFK